MRALLLILGALAAGCYSPNIAECTITCGVSGSCPSDTTCMSDGFCHADVAATCQPLNGDGVFNMVDAKAGIDAPKFDARPGQPDAPFPIDARPGEPDARPDARPGEPDARPDAAMPPDSGVLCTNAITPIEGNDSEQSLISNLSVEPNGTLHVTYYDSVRGELRYARRAPGQDWAFQDVAAMTDILKGQTLDSTGALHVAFSDAELLTPRLRYARRSPQGAWKVETVDDTGISGVASVAVDPNLGVHIAYWYNLSDLMYARRSASASGLFTTSPIDTDGTVGEHPSIGVSPAGTVNVSYRLAGTRNDLGLAVLKPAQSNWNLQHPDTNGNVGSYTALAVDGSGNLHIAYADITNEQLKYAFIPVNGNSVMTTVEPSVGVGRFNSIALDASGGIHIAYYAYGEQNLKYAVKRANQSMFSARTVDSAGNVGRHASIGVDALGIVHISYTDDTNGDIKYARICP